MLGVHVGPAHEPLEVGLGHRVVPGAHRRRHLDGGPAGQLPQREVDVAVQRGLQRHGRVQHLRVGASHTVGVDAGVVLPRQHQPVGNRRLGGHPGQAQLEVAVGGLARPLGQLGGQPGQESELHRVADLGLGVAQHVGGGAGELGEGDLGVAVHEHVLRGHIHVVEHHQRVALVIDRRQRVVASRGDVAAVGPAGVDAQPGVVHGDHHRQAVVVGTWRQGLDGADEQVVRHQRAGAEHLRAPHHHPVVAGAGDGGVEMGLVLLVGPLGPVDLGMDDGVGDVEVLVAGPFVEALDVVGVAVAGLGESVERAREAGEERGHMVGGPSQVPVAELGPGLDGQPAAAQVFHRAGHQPAQIHRAAVIGRLVGHELAVGGIGREVIQPGHAAHGAGEGRMGRDVVDGGAVEDHVAPVSERLDVAVPCAHPPSVGTRGAPGPGPTAGQIV